MKISVIGSTGSIGRQTLEIAERFPDRFTVVSLCANSDWQELLRQIIKFRPENAAIVNPKSGKLLKENLPQGIKTELYCGENAAEYIADIGNYDLSIISTVGISGLKPVISSLKQKKEIALATKEALVVGGSLVMELAGKHNITIRPIDSEHSAIFQCIRDERKYLSKIILTSSGGPFRGRKELSGIIKEEVLNHPTWKMGNKITVDCANLMNKGFEVIEAAFIFNMKPENIEVIIHPQSIIHSLVEFCDGSNIAHLSPPDMRVAIQYALSLPERLPYKWSPLDLTKTVQLTFEKPDLVTFPCLKLAYEALKTGKTMPAALNGANEMAVAAFLNDEIEFKAIASIIEKVLEKQELLDATTLDNLFYADREARKAAKREIEKCRI